MTYDLIIEDPKYAHWKDDAGIQIADKKINRRLTSFELDQLFNYFGPVKISEYVNDFTNARKLKEGIKKIEEDLEKELEKLR